MYLLLKKRVIKRRIALPVDGGTAFFIHQWEVSLSDYWRMNQERAANPAGNGVGWRCGLIP
jgi:hypothetical protein